MSLPQQQNRDEPSAMPISRVRELVGAIINRTMKPEVAADEFAEYIKDESQASVLLAVLQQAVGSGSAEIYVNKLRTWVHISS
ncbi:MAG TPA: hypothetical protein VJB98_04240 [Candidatus Paceibacterota bacterium]